MRMEGLKTATASAGILQEPAVQAALLDLHSTLKFRDLWCSLQRLFETVAPHDTLVMSVNYLDWRHESSKWRLSSANSRRPHDEETNRMVAGLGSAFFQPFLDARPGIRVYRHSQIVEDPRQITRTPYYRNCMAANGWRYSAHLLLWSGNHIETSVALRRHSSQGDFSDHEMEALSATHPHLEVALRRIRVFEEERQRRRLLERFYRGRPGAVVYLDWEMRVVYASEDAVETFAQLNFGSKASRHLAPRAVFALPAGIEAACAELRDAWMSNSIDRAAGESLAKAVIEAEGIEALVTMRPEKRGTLTKPVFEIRLRAAERQPLPALRPLHDLSPGERGLADLVCRGMSNKQIAAELGKTEGTVKAQLSGVFRKLGVDSRSRLILAMR